MRQFLILSVLFILTFNVSGQSWTMINPLFSDANLNDICFPVSNTGYIAGNYGTVLKSTDGGDTWQHVAINTSAKISDVSFIDGNKGLVLDGNGDIFLTVNGGSAWTNESVQNLQLASFNIEFISACYLTQDKITAVGHINNNVYSVYTTNGGNTWDTTLIYPNFNSFNLSIPIFFINPDTGFIGGNNVTKMYKTTDGGQTWSFIHEWGNFSAVSFSFTNSDTGFFVGLNGNSACGTIGQNVFMTTNGGNTWTQDYVSAYTNYINTIFFIDQMTGFIAGSGGFLQKTTDGGASWNSVSNCHNRNISEILFINSSTGFQIGDGGLICKTTDGGNNWSVITSIETHLGYNAVDFPSSATGYTAGSNGFFKTTDSGQTWNNISVITTPPITNYFVDLSFTDEDSGYVAANYSFAKTNDGGSAWTSGSFGISSRVTSVYSSSPDTVIAIAGYCDDYNPEQQYIIKSNDAGATWNNKIPTEYGELAEIEFPDKNTGYVGGSICGNYQHKGVIYKTSDGGETWDSTVFSQRVISMSFPTVNTGYLVLGTPMTYTAVLYKTTDGGASWNILQNFTLIQPRRIRFVNSNTGYITDYINGNLWKTTDGGINWIQETIPTHSVLNDIVFTSANIGISVGVNGVIIRNDNILTGNEVTTATKSGFTVYPNPASSYVRVFSEEYNIKRLEIFNSLGSLIKSEEIEGNDYNVDISNIPSGIYLINIISDNYINSGRLIICR